MPVSFSGGAAATSAGAAFGYQVAQGDTVTVPEGEFFFVIRGYTLKLDGAIDLSGFMVSLD